MILSLWRLTFDPTGTPLVLLDYGDMVGEELAPAWADVVQAVQWVRGKNTANLNRGNRSGKLTWNRQLPPGLTVWAARAAVFSAATALPCGMGASILQIEVARPNADGTYTTMERFLAHDAAVGTGQATWNDDAVRPVIGYEAAWGALTAGGLETLAMTDQTAATLTDQTPATLYTN